MPKAGPERGIRPDPMTLTRQLLTGITIAFIALLVGIEAIYVAIAKSYLEEQLDAHANETATSLALSLGARATSLDASLVNIMINPVFDRGYFELIEVRSPNRERVFGRTLERRSIDVPAWFVALVPLEGPRGEALITAGWKQLGKVIVQVHPGYAYQQLYSTATATLAWLAALFVLALLWVRHYLAGILRPLAEIERTALAISNRNFVSIGIEPRARELARVTRAMNSLSAKIREVITQESGHAERLRKEAFEDSLTGLLNRRGFEQSVAAALEDGSEVHSGVLALFFVSGMEEVNRLFGLSRGNEILRQLAEMLEAPGTHGPAIVGRWQGPTLAAFIPNIEPQAAVVWAEALGKTFSAHLRVEGLPASAVLSGGLAHFAQDVVALARLAEAAEIAVQSALTGHLVYTTVHSNNVFDVMGRLLHMKIDPYSLVAAINAVMAQRLIRTNCPHCAIPYHPDPELLSATDVIEDAVLASRCRRGAGCNECRGSGYRGRKAIGELLVVDDHLRALLMDRAAPRIVKEHAVATGTRFLRDSALDMVRSGETTLEEANRVTLAA